jgi:hypothetical protein
MLEGEEHVRHLIPLARGTHPFLEREPIPILDGVVDMADPELGEIAP